VIKEKLELKIKDNDDISFSEYMEIVLFDKEHGFYEKENILGKYGHFITSPLISKHFSNCIAKNYIQVCKEEKLNNIVELGAGDAELSKNLIHYLKDKKYLPKKYYFFDKSSFLISKQKKVIKDLDFKNDIDFIWIDKYEDLPNKAFIIANELFDCIPTDIIRFKKNYYEKAYINKTFDISWKKYNLFSKPSAKYLSVPDNLRNNYIFEFSHEQYQIINGINKFIDKAYFLIFDYGYSASELYINDRMDGTIACIKNHLSDFNPLSEIGEKDISAFVNFSYLKNIFMENNWSASAFMNQGNYLLSFDILNDININNLDEVGSIKKLIMPNQMGEIFKVLIVQKNTSKISDNNFIKNDIIKL